MPSTTTAAAAAANIQIIEDPDVAAAAAETITNHKSKGFQYPPSPGGNSVRSGTQESSERDSDDCYADVGFMFDGCQPSTLKRFQWVREPLDTSSNNNKPEVRVAVHVVDDGPAGALQSGHYLWPAAPALAEALLVNPSGIVHPKNPRNILELGAGCALVSLTALQVLHPSLQCVVVTDRDPGTLERARDSYETTLEDLLEATESEEEQMDCINGISSIPMLFECLSWGNESMAQQVARAASEHSSPLVLPTTTHSSSEQQQQQQQQQEQQTALNPNYNAERNMFDLILGTDLIYSIDVIEPLFQTVSHFMTVNGSFLYAQSFSYDPESEQAIEDICAKLQLKRTVLCDTLGGGEKEEGTQDVENAGVKIQQFTWPVVKHSDEEQQEENVQSNEGVVKHSEEEQQEEKVQSNEGVVKHSEEEQQEEKVQSNEGDTEADTQEEAASENSS